MFLLLLVVRRRWRDGYRKCSRCGIMYQISQNGPTSCEFEDFGFNEKHGGRYKYVTRRALGCFLWNADSLTGIRNRFKRKGEHSMALPRYPVDARIVDDIKISAGCVSCLLTFFLGLMNIDVCRAYGAGALDQAEVAGIIGPSNEMISGWVPDVSCDVRTAALDSTCRGSRPSFFSFSLSLYVCSLLSVSLFLKSCLEVILGFFGYVHVS